MGTQAVFLGQDVIDLIDNADQVRQEKVSVIKEYKIRPENIHSVCHAYNAFITEIRQKEIDAKMEMSALLNKAVSDKQILDALILGIKYSIVLKGSDVEKRINDPEKAEKVIRELEKTIEKNEILTIGIEIEKPIQGYKIVWTEVLSPERSIFGEKIEENSLLNLAWSRTTKSAKSEKDLIYNAEAGWNLDPEKTVTLEINKKILRVINLQHMQTNFRKKEKQEKGKLSI